MRNVPPGIQTMFSNGGLPGSDCACLAEVMVTLLLITSSSLLSNPIFLSSIHQNPLSFRPSGEIFLRSLAFARGDGPRPLLSEAEGTPSTQRITQAELCLAKSCKAVYWTLVQYEQGVSFPNGNRNPKHAN